MLSSPDPDYRRPRRAALWGLLGVLVIAVVMLGMVWATGGFEAPTGDADGDRTVHSTTDTMTMDLPGEDRASAVEFSADAGSTAVVTFSADATLDSSIGQRRGAYTSSGVTCSSIDGQGSSQAISSTENLEHQQQRNLTVSFVYEPRVSGQHRCNGNVRVTSWDAQNAAATMDIESTLDVEQEPDALQVEAQTDAQDPILVAEGETATVVDRSVDVPRGDRTLRLAATSHLTTCTGVNGSKDQTRENLCTPGIVNEDGSSVTVRSTAEILDGDRVCQRLEIQNESLHITRMVHHKVLGAALQNQDLPDGLCGSRIRLVQTLENSGPAPVIAHRGSSNVVLSVSP